jgi:hypothetical protein
MKAKHLFASFLFVIILVLLNKPALAQVLWGEKSLHGLKGIDIVVEDIGRFDPADGLSGKLVREDVERKLKSAGIKILSEAAGSPYLHVDINTWKEKDGTYLASLELSLKQEVKLERDPSIKLSAITWMESQLITEKAGELSKVLRGEVGRLVEKFVSDYKSENPSDAAKAPPNKSFEPTANSAAFIRKTPCLTR